MDKKEKKRSLAKELLMIIISLSFFALFIGLANVNALQNINHFTDRIENAGSAYDKAIESGDVSQISEAQDDMALAIKQTRTRIRGTYTFNVILTVFTFILAGIFIVVVKHKIAKPAQIAKTDMDAIISSFRNGKGDLSIRICDTSKNEIGQLAYGMNQFLGVLQTLMSKIQDASVKMNDSIELLSNGAENSNANVSNVSATTQELASSMEEISATLEQITVGCNEISALVNEISEHASGASTTLVQVNEKAHNSYKQAIEAKDTTISTFNELQIVTNEAVNESQNVTEIESLTDNILSIATQTNLLALNASIEAARAGDAGKGFAVVADEIRKLADDSKETANGIQEISSHVIAAVQRLADSTNQMIAFVNESVVSDYDGFVKTISDYESDAKLVSETFSKFANMAENAAGSMNDMNDGMQSISCTIEEATKGITNVADEMSSLVESIASISSQADINKEISNGLHNEVDRFENVK